MTKGKTSFLKKVFFILVLDYLILIWTFFLIGKTIFAINNIEQIQNIRVKFACKTFTMGNVFHKLRGIFSRNLYSMATKMVISDGKCPKYNESEIICKIFLDGRNVSKKYKIQASILSVTYYFFCSCLLNLLN